MSFMTALASCWDVFRSKYTEQDMPMLFSFYETYTLPDLYTANHLPAGIYEHKHAIETVHFDEQQNRSYRVRVGLTSVEDKLVDSFFGLPLAILKLLNGLAAACAFAFLLVFLCGIVLPFLVIGNFILLFIEPKKAVVTLGIALICIGFLLALTMISLLIAVYHPLKALLKIPVGIVIGIDALIKLALGKSIDPPTITEVDSLDNQDVVRNRGLTVKAVDNQFEVALKGIGFKETLPDRYLCRIGAGVIDPVLLNDGYIYTKSTAENLLASQPSVGPFDRTPLSKPMLVLTTYRAEIQALVEALTDEHTNATHQNRLPNYNLILERANQYSEIAEALHETLMKPDQLKSRLDSESRDSLPSINLVLKGQSYIFTLSKQTIQTALQIIEPIIGKVSVENVGSPKEAVETFLNKLDENPNRKRLFVTALTEAILAEKNFAAGFKQAATSTQSNRADPSVSEQITLGVGQFNFWGSSPRPASSTQVSVPQSGSSARLPH